MKIKFWGTRGLISSPSKETAVYGGNTTCMQLIHKNQIIIIDTGFGACNLGEELMPKILEGGESLQIHIFFTHFHWDHIQGLPFFHPIYFESSTINIYSPLPVNVAHANLNLLFDGSYSPFAGIDSMASAISFHQLTTPVLVDGITVDSIPLDHGQSSDEGTESHCFALSFTDADENKIVVATDHEGRPSDTNKKLLEFAKGADILVHDAQYTQEEYQSRVGWGHSTFSQAVENGKRSNAKKVLLTHHHPSRTDAEIEEIAEKMCSDPRFASVDFEFAKEKTVYSPEQKAKK
ncbi:MBL fold metallo-hydrolase [bacterium]|nr:MBL fold metallo-hydrolase [bacterium]